MSDAALWQRYCAGDTAAFDRLYQRFRSPLYRYLRRQCGDCAESEELYQDVWLNAVRARDRFDGEHLQAWLFRIAHNRLIDYYRSSGRAAELVSDDQDVDDIASQAGLSGDESPDRWSFLRDCVERLFAMLEALPFAQRDAFLLKEESGLSLEQIAEVSATSRETVKSRLRYAMQRLRSGLEDCDE
ncbi:MAG: sigma-70 family RNA polymerase sigma factor [Gammaproteobacteria bacterium]|nr:sigma-70 family RNA polymerase sigma factor [Gammaproteobacteria bacterium]MCP5135327.1 sigma-70 family RNA polymerase sigma factor [Gammaproteobacteria bacterium]